MIRTPRPCRAVPVLLLLLSLGHAAAQTGPDREPHRPRFHFTPKRNWMNDPNGLVRHEGVYHMFFQHHPDGNRWGPMHWGHAVSRDLLTWEEKPIALYPDSMGYIFSGSAVVDSLNTSGFGMEGKTPIVAIFTHHNPVREAAGQRGFQYQSLAYSLDDGETWKKFPGNPVLQDTAATDFRDPKVHWHEATGRWVMSLATRDRVTFFSSPDLKAWARESAFGEKLGAHGGVWECPDLFPIEHKGRTVWVLLVSINPGAPNGGSGTQYFLGDFDGHRFKPFDDNTRWIDYGTDDYAGVTFSNTGDRRIFIGWMSNWNYAQDVPTEAWRSAMTIPRELYISEDRHGLLLCSRPAKEIEDRLNHTKEEWTAKHPKGGYTVPSSTMLEWKDLPATDFTIELHNDSADRVVIGYEASERRFFIDRSSSGRVDFAKGFAGRQYAPRLAANARIDLRLFIDAASVELFADGGSTVMTSVFFPRSPFDRMTVAGIKSRVLIVPIGDWKRP